LNLGPVGLRNLISPLFSYKLLATFMKPPNVAAKGVLVPKSFHAILAHHHISIDFAMHISDMSG